MNSFNIIRFKMYTNMKLSFTEMSYCFVTISPTGNSTTMNCPAAHFHLWDLKLSSPIREGDWMECSETDSP